MKRKNYDDLEKFVKRLKERIAVATEVELQTESTKDLFESILNYEIFVCNFMLDILLSERVCSHCSILEKDGKK
jgi:hypothetical protein